MNDATGKPKKEELRIPNGIWITITVIIAVIFAAGAAALAVAEPWAGIPAFDFYTGPQEAQMEKVTVAVGESVTLAPELTENEAVRTVSVSDPDILSNDGLTVTALGDYDGASVFVTTQEKWVPESSVDSVVVFGRDVTESYNSLRSWLRREMGLEGVVNPRTELRDVCVYTCSVTVDGCEIQQDEDPVKLIVGQANGIISADDGLDHEVTNDNEAAVEATVAVGRVILTPLSEGNCSIVVYSGFYKTPEGGEKVFVPVRACRYSVEVTPGSGHATYTPPSGSSQSSQSTSQSAPTTAYVYSNNYSAASAMLAMVNAARAEAGVGQLTWSQSLADTAAIRSREAAVSFSHTRPDGTPWYTVSGLARGENLAAGYSTAASAFNGLMNSEGHRANILRDSFTTMGACLCTTDAPGYKYFWCQLFG